MSPVCQNTDQKATTKKSKIHRSAPEISRKVIAFVEISEANKELGKNNFSQTESY